MCRWFPGEARTQSPPAQTYLPRTYQTCSQLCIKYISVIISEKCANDKPHHSEIEIAHVILEVLNGRRINGTEFTHAFILRFNFEFKLFVQRNELV